MFVAALVMSQMAPRAAAQLPTAKLFSIYPSGGKQGTTVEVTITGGDLEEVNQLYFDHPGIKAELVQEMKDGKPVPVPAAGPAKFKVTVAPDVPLGLHDVRAIGRFGISNPRTFVVGDMIEVNETEPNNVASAATRVLADKVPSITVNGQINGATDIDYFVFSARAGQRILVDCYGQRIDSRLNGRLMLTTATGKLLAANDDFHDRDPFLDVTIPADGDYIVGVTDQVFDGSPEYAYRLNIGTLPYIDYVLPPAAAPGTTGPFTVFGRNLPGGQPAPGISVGGRPLEQLTVQIAVPGDPLALQRLSYSGLVLPRESTTDGFEYRLATPQGSSNGVLIGVTTLPVVAGTEPNETFDKAQAITLPCEIYGQFQAPRDVDWYTFTAKANEEWVFEVISQRMGFPTDPFLLLRRASDGAEIPLPNQDDDETSPIGLRFATRTDDPTSISPALAEGQYQLGIRHQYGDSMGNPRFVYRLRARPKQPDFRVVAIHNIPAIAGAAQPPDSLIVRQGGNQHLDVWAIRRDGFNGEITIQAEGLPAGVTCPPVTIGPGAPGQAPAYAPLVFSAADNAPIAVGPITIKGTATIGGQPVVRDARPAVITWAFDPNQQIRSQSRLARTIPLAVRDGAPYRVVATPEKATISRGLPLKVKLQITRRGDFKDQVVGLVFVNGTPPIPGLQAQPINIAANQNEIEATYNLPPNSPVGNYTIALRGNAPAVPFTKDPEGKNKANIQVGDISTPVILTVTDPLGMVVNPNTVAVKKGASVDVNVTLTRQGGYDGPVNLQLVQLPAGVTQQNNNQAITVAKEAAAGKLTATAAANAAAGNFTNVLVRATVQVGGQNVNIDAPLTVNVE
jgi:hypothetical protein